MEAEKFRGLDVKELTAKARETEEQLFRLRFQMSMGQLDGLKKYRELRKDRARLQTVLREREISAAREGASK